MNKFIVSAVAVATLATVSVGATSQAEARGLGGPLAVGILGGLIVGSAIAASQPHYGPRHYRARYYDECGPVFSHYDRAGRAVYVDPCY